MRVSGVGGVVGGEGRGGGGSDPPPSNTSAPGTPLPGSDAEFFVRDPQSQAWAASERL